MAKLEENFKVILGIQSTHRNVFDAELQVIKEKIEAIDYGTELDQLKLEVEQVNPNVLLEKFRAEMKTEIEQSIGEIKAQLDELPSHRDTKDQ